MLGLRWRSLGNKTSYHGHFGYPQVVRTRTNLAASAVSTTPTRPRPEGLPPFDQGNRSSCALIVNRSLEFHHVKFRLETHHIAMFCCTYLGFYVLESLLRFLRQQLISERFGRPLSRENLPTKWATGRDRAYCHKYGAQRCHAIWSRCRGRLDSRE